MSSFARAQRGTAAQEAEVKKEGNKQGEARARAEDLAKRKARRDRKLCRAGSVSVLGERQELGQKKALEDAEIEAEAVAIALLASEAEKEGKAKKRNVGKAGGKAVRSHSVRGSREKGKKDAHPSLPCPLTLRELGFERDATLVVILRSILGEQKRGFRLWLWCDEREWPPVELILGGDTCPTLADLCSAIAPRIHKHQDLKNAKEPLSQNHHKDTDKPCLPRMYALGQFACQSCAWDLLGYVKVEGADCVCVYDGGRVALDMSLGVVEAMRLAEGDLLRVVEMDEEGGKGGRGIVKGLFDSRFDMAGRELRAERDRMEAGGGRERLNIQREEGQRREVALSFHVDVDEEEDTIGK